MTAYEELKAWCEKHLAPEDYRVIPESRSYYTTIYLDVENDDLKCIIFTTEGRYVNMSTCTNEDMCDHIEDYEHTEEAPKPDPMPTSIGGMMVRKMIEAYERNMNK